MLTTNRRSEKCYWELAWLWFGVFCFVLLCFFLVFRRFHKRPLCSPLYLADGLGILEDGKKNIFFIGDCGRLKYNFSTTCFFSMTELYVPTHCLVSCCCIIWEEYMFLPYWLWAGFWGILWLMGCKMWHESFFSRSFNLDVCSLPSPIRVACLR